MLMSMELLFILTLFTMSFKKYQESISMIIMFITMMFIMIYPMSNHIYFLSKISMLDTLSTMMIILTLWISLLMISSNYFMKSNKKMFLLMIILLLIILINLFLTNNLITFYIMFESSIIPIALLIMLWGHQPERKMASLYIIIYTVAASLPLLMILMVTAKINFHFNLSLLYMILPNTMNKSLSWLMWMTAFFVKLPLFSLHLWLPKAHVEAPLAGSMILAAVLLKLGSYGLLRMHKIIHFSNLNMFNILISISTLGMLITNIMCLRQTDLKSLIAYSSVSHMGLMIIGLFSDSKLGQYGSLVIMLSHGLTSSSMFMLTSTMYEKINSRNIMLMSGTLSYASMISMMWMITMMANMALPPSLNILGEIMIMMSSLLISKIILILLMASSLSTMLYSIYLYSMINHGNQLKSINFMSPSNSMTMMNWFSHMWPLVMMLTISSKLMSWCYML